MDFHERRALLRALVIAGMSMLDRANAQQRFGFDPVAFAKLRAGEIVREISGSERDTTALEPSRDVMFNTGLLLQAGLRALLPVQERQGVALPGTPSPNDPTELIDAQENYRAVFESGANATPAQNAIALKSIELASRQLEKAGYIWFSEIISEWVVKQRL